MEIFGWEANRSLGYCPHPYYPKRGRAYHTPRPCQPERSEAESRRSKGYCTPTPVSLNGVGPHHTPHPCHPEQSEAESKDLQWAIACIIPPNRKRRRAFRHRLLCRLYVGKEIFRRGAPPLAQDDNKEQMCRTRPCHPKRSRAHHTPRPCHPERSRAAFVSQIKDLGCATSDLRRNQRFLLGHERSPVGYCVTY